MIEEQICEHCIADINDCLGQKHCPMLHGIKQVFLKHVDNVNIVNQWLKAQCCLHNFSDGDAGNCIKCGVSSAETSRTIHAKYSAWDECIQATKQAIKEI